MGHSTSKLNSGHVTIDLAESEKKVYRTDEVVSGTISYNHASESQIKLKNVIIKLVGELVYTTSNDKRASKWITNQRVCFFTEQVIVKSTDEEDGFILKPGNNLWSFSFHLNDTLPPTTEQTHNQGPFIQYFIYVALNQYEWYKQNIDHQHSIVVLPTNSIAASNQLEEDSDDRDGISLRMGVDQNSVFPGGNLILQIHLENPLRKNIHRISAKLIQDKRFGPAKEKREFLLAQNLLSLDNFRDENLQRTIILSLPDKITPSFICKPKEWPFRNPMIIHYELCLEAHIHCCFRNIVLTLPVTVANPLKTITNDTVHPPSYESLFPN